MEEINEINRPLAYGLATPIGPEHWDDVSGGMGFVLTTRSTQHVSGYHPGGLDFVMDYSVDI